MAMKIHEPDQTEHLSWPRVKILGFDPSMTSTGWCIIDFVPYREPIMVVHGKFGTSPTGIGQSMRDSLMRMEEIARAARGIADLAVNERVGLVALELPVPSPKGVGSQAGSMACTAVQTAHRPILQVPTVFVHPNHSKKVTTGDGNSSKAHVQSTVARWLKIPKFPGNQDESDAASAAICTALDLIEGRLDKDYPEVASVYR